MDGYQVAQKIQDQFENVEGSDELRKPFMCCITAYSETNLLRQATN